MQCRAITNQERHDIFKKFWAEMTWDQRKIYVNLQVKKENTLRGRNRKEENKSRREYTWIYYLQTLMEKNYRVCKKMFLNTLDLNERTIIDWKNGPQKTIEKSQEKEKEQNATEKLEKDRKEILKEFFRDLPKVESHYCRSRTTKSYLESTWSSKSELYRFYKSYCDNLETKCVSTALFSHVFDELNLAIFKPKKDECDIFSVIV